MDNIDWTRQTRPGYRLKKVEVTNWGTFDSTGGQVYSLQLDGRTSLLVGQNGSGKSTLVDALLTLLVQPGIRNYNVAAGAKKRERDERTYIRGACGRTSDEELGSVIEYLRSDKHYSVLLASFHRDDTDDSFTVAQILQINSDGDVDKTYAFAPTEKSIAGDLSRLIRGENMRKQVAERGFRTSTKYSEYIQWVARQTHMRTRAMDVFNQTVAVKDIQSLNRFIRDHMLEARPWRDRIEQLLGHFTQLTQAHQAVVKARRQVELLEPIQAVGKQLAAVHQKLGTCQHQLEAVDSFIRQHVVSWLQPRLTQDSQAVAQSHSRKDELQREIDALDEAARQLKNEIEESGGERLRQLPLQLETQQALHAAKNRELSRLQSALKLLPEQIAVDSADDFARLPERLSELQQRLTERANRLAEERLDRARLLNELRSAIEDEQAESGLLEQQPGHLPPWLADIRRGITGELKLPESELVFACELISVDESESAWQPVIETVLRRFALSLLVPEQHYRAVSQYVEQHRLTDRRGRGQKLVYLRVGDPTAPTNGDAQLHLRSLVRKLVLRQEHRLSAWLEGELKRRFDFTCCDSIEQFQQFRGPAVTLSRHIKFGNQQHEKDDRAQATESQRFVLGWDNSRRISEVARRLETLREQEHEVEASIDELEEQSRGLSKQLAAVDTASGIPNFELVDVKRHERAIEQLRSEQVAIESSNDSVRVLRQRLDETIERRFAAQRERDTAIAIESSLLRECDQAAHLLERHQQVLSRREQEESWPQVVELFESLSGRLGSQLSSVKEVGDFAELQSEFTQQLQSELNHLNRRMEPLQADVIRAMQRFLSENPEESDDLRADLAYVDGFIGLLEQLRTEDLPRHEQRFRQRLNDKVIQEIGVFHAALQCERQEIQSKIEQLNGSLEQLEYQPGTYMRLEPRSVQDREIRDFQNLLRECLEDQFDGDAHRDDTRFARIERLLRRLREEERWREKVTDVRRWFDFAARELDMVSGRERSCYEDSSGQSGGEKAKLAFTILVAAIAYQFDIDPHSESDDRLRFVVVDEMFSKVDDRYAEYALQLFEKFGLQLLIVAPLDAKARVTEDYVGCYLHTVKNERTRTSNIISMTADDYRRAVAGGPPTAPQSAPVLPKPR